MDFGEIVEKFAASLQIVYGAIDASHAQPEDQLKPPIKALIESFGIEIGAPIIATTEAQMADLKGRPDVAIAVDGLVTGHIELKAPGKGARTTKLKGGDAEQWKKFRNHPNLIYTDGNEWALYRTGERQGEVVRFAGDATSDGTAAVSPDNVRDLEILLRDFTGWEPIVPTSPRRLAETLAPLCRLLRDDAFAALSNGGSAMRMLANEWRVFLFADADDRQFADAYAQTVTYALLLARVEGEANLSVSSAAKQLDERHGLLAQVLRILEQDEAREEVRVPIELLERIDRRDRSHDDGRRRQDRSLALLLRGLPRRLRPEAAQRPRRLLHAGAGGPGTGPAGHRAAERTVRQAVGDRRRWTWSY